MRTFNFSPVKLRLKPLFFIILTLTVSTYVNAQPFGYAYTKNAAIDQSNVSGATDLINFPVLLHFTDPDLRTIANGGHVTHPLGYDIIFTLDDCALPLYHQVERYNPVTGELMVWVRMPVLVSGADTEFKMYYGNSAIVAPTESPNTWSSHYSMVQHMQNNPGAAAPQMLDATVNAHNGTSNGGMTIANSVAGKIDEAIQFDGTNDHIIVPDFDYSSAPLGFTVSFWFRVVDNSGFSYQYMFSHNNYGIEHSLNIYFAEASVPVAGDANVLKTIFRDFNDALSTEGLDSSPTYADGNWHYYTFTVGNAPGGDWVYVDGVEIATLSYQGSDDFTPPGNIYLGARTDLSASRYLKGFLDEVRILNEYRSADWIKTEYDNQNNPIGFATFGPEMDSYINCLVLPVELLTFNAIPAGERSVLVDWITDTEINTDYFTIERTADGIHYEVVGTVDAAGQSSAPIHYQITDDKAYEGTSYYRLTTTDIDGSSTYSDLKSVHFDGTSIINVFPNPATDQIHLMVQSGQNGSIAVTITDVTGRAIDSKTFQTEKGSNLLTLSLEDYAKGQYFVHVGNEREQHLSRIFYVQ